VVVVGVPAVLFGIASIKVKGVRQLAISLAVLGVFALLGYCASFYSTLSERSRVTRNLSARVRLLRSAPTAMRGIGDLASRSDYDPRIARRMLNVYNYTLQAGRVLAYIGTRDCVESLIEALDHPEKARSSELIHVLREETGLDFGFDARHPRAANLQALAAWKNWWQRAQSSYPETLEAAPAAGDTSAG